MINWNENENDNGKIDRISKTYIDQPRGRHRDKYRKYSVTMSLSNIWGSIC